MNKFFSMMIAFMCAFALMACATTGSGYDPTEIARLRAENQRLRTEGERAEEERLCLQEYVACTTRGDRNCPETCAEAVTRQRREERQARTASATASTMPGVPMASPMSSVAPGLPTMPPLCPGVDPMFGSVPPWAQIPTSAMGFSNGAPLVTNADPNIVLVFADPGFYFSVEINGRVMNQYTGTQGVPTMIVVRHQATNQACRMPAMTGRRTIVRFLPDSFEEGQSMLVHAWYAPTDATGVPRIGTHVGRACEQDPRRSRNSADITSRGCTSS